MSRSINAIQVKLKQLGLNGGIIRRTRYTSYLTSVTSAYLPEDGPLGFFFVGEDGKESYLGKTLNESLSLLDQWGTKRKAA